MTGAAVLPVAGLVLAACELCPRVPSVEGSDPLFERFEAPDAANTCDDDGDCMVSGCSGEICAAACRRAASGTRPTAPGWG